VTEGFLVVDVNAEDLSKVLNRRYRGLYRMVAVRPEDMVLLKAELFSAQAEPAGLIQTAENAKKLLRSLTDLRPLEPMEIIFARASDDAWGPPLEDATLELLGIDVAADAPFYSIVADMPRDPRLAKFERLLNEHGLFRARNHAADYAQSYFSNDLSAGDSEPPLKLWEVYRVKD
jgi:hypothetical protein